MKRVLITGAAGAIGKVLRAAYRGKYRLRLSDIAPLGEAAPGEELVPADLADAAACDKMMQGVDCVVHLGGVAVEDAWEKILPANIAGCYNVFEAARRAGVKRVIFASSNHAVGFHRRERFIDDRVQPRPDTRYGVSKVFGEALGRLYADKHGLSVACLRIGTFRNPDRPSQRAPAARPGSAIATWCSWSSAASTIRITTSSSSTACPTTCATAGTTGNVKFLGYRPEDDAEIYAGGDPGAGRGGKRNLGALPRRLFHARWNSTATLRKSIDQRESEPQ